MPFRSRYVLHDAALYGLLACEESEILRLIAAFEQLALERAPLGEFTVREAGGRALYFRRCGAFAIAFAPPHPGQPIEILDVLNLSTLV